MTDMTSENSCITCKLAEWSRTAAGRLHPSGDGRCRWKMPAIPIPASRYYIGGSRDAIPQPSGGAIERHKPYHDCPTWESSNPINRTGSDIARPLAEWHEDFGPMLWWSFPIEEAPWAGTPNDSNWPGYHTHWTPILLPALPWPEPPAEEPAPGAGAEQE
jgi:hypothetical protein